MEPGEYLTNVLSSNNYTSIQYEYYEPQTQSTRITRKHLQKIEAGWRQDGSLVHCDAFRDGIWIFQSATDNATISVAKGSSVTESSNLVEVLDSSLLLREKGTYEPASLARNKSATLNSLSATSMSLSPSSSLENAIRNAQTVNSRAVQMNSAQNVMNEPATLSPGAKSTAGPTDAWPSLKEIHEYFISAALGSIVYFLCHDHGFVPLNSRTLILTYPGLPTSDLSGSNMVLQDSPITLATLDISLTSLGGLVVKAQSDTAPGLQSLVNASGSMNQVPSGTSLWLAPGGNAAKLYGTQDERKMPGSLPISHLQTTPADHLPHSFNGATIQSWQSKCLDWLSAKGLNVAALEEGGWIFVQVLGGNSPYSSADYQGIELLEDLAIVPWPALLCFQTSNSRAQDLQSTTIDITSRDPLAFAEVWYTSREDRAGIMLKRQKERQAAEATSREQADVEARALQSTTYSPVTLGRGSNGGAMYPTPPDVVHHPVGATPSFDGTVSTPGNPNPPFAPDVEAAVQNTNPGAVDTEGDIWGSSGKKEHTNAVINFNENDAESDNLFGDVGGDLFGDITDADFNFFDAPDVLQMDQHPSSPGPPILPDGQEPSTFVEASVLDITSADPLEAPDTLMEDSSPADSTNRAQGTKFTETHPPNIRTEHGEVVMETNDIVTEQAPQLAVTPPFSKEAIFKRLFQRPLDGNSSASIFNKVEFQTSLLSVNEKYGANGRFGFRTEGKSLQGPVSLGLPETEYLSRRRKVDEEQGSRSLARILRETASMVDIETADDEPMLYLMDSDLASQLSEQDDTSHTSEDQSVVLKPGVKRKWIMENDDGDDVSSSFNALAVEYEHPADTPMSINCSQIPLLEGDPADWSLATYFTSPEPDVQSNALSDLEYIASAQILADQAVSGTFKLPGASRTTQDAYICSPKTSRTRALMHTLAKATKVCFKDLTPCTLRSFLEIQGIPILNQGLRLPPRPIPNPRGAQILDASKSNKPFPIPPRQLEVRRSDTTLLVLPSAVNFWENLGLGPSKGSKDITAVCVYPNFDGVSANASTFLDQMRSVYESFRLGCHDRIISNDLGDSLLPFAVDLPQQTNMIHSLATLKETVARLSRVLSSLPIGDKNIVVYFIYPVENAALLVHICTAFQHLFNLYRKALSERKTNTANELVLQLVPLDFVASSTSIMIPLPSEYARLAMEVYDRCIDFASASSTPGILLEQPLPKSIDFKLNSFPSASLLQENSCLHIAYAQSIDDRWITAAWTNNRGNQKMTASYCLGRKNEPLSMPFSDVANEIWETTLDIISSKKIHWRIMIARVGVMDPSEIEFWTGLASTEANAQINLTLITVQTDPSLRLLPLPVTLTPNSNGAQSVVTPVSTPQALQSSIVSPENATPPARDSAANAATPGENAIEPDGDARLIDFTDQTWGAVLGHRLNNSNSLLELNPALISGYLIKRGGIDSDDPPIVMEVNIIHSEVAGNPRTFHEGLLREILGYYRGLGTLARVRGIVDTIKDVRPWHIAAAEKAVKSLYMLM